MIEPGDIGGVHIKYLHHCRRQLWLYARGFRPEHLSERVQLGEAVHETSYDRSKEIDLGAARIDHFDGAAWVHEVKSSAAATRSDEAQALHYCLRLHDVGVVIHGAVLHFPKTRRTVRIPWNPEKQAEARADVEAALAAISEPASPPRFERRSDCRGCSYADYCWTD